MFKVVDTTKGDYSGYTVCDERTGKDYGFFYADEYDQAHEHKRRLECSEMGTQYNSPY